MNEGGGKVRRQEERMKQGRILTGLQRLRFISVLTLIFTQYLTIATSTAESTHALEVRHDDSFQID